MLRRGAIAPQPSPGATTAVLLHFISVSSYRVQTRLVKRKRIYVSMVFNMAESLTEISAGGCQSFSTDKPQLIEHREL